MQLAPAEASPRPWSAASLRIVMLRTGTPTLFVVVPAILFLSALIVAITDAGDYAFDFQQFWRGAHDVVTGSSPYPSQALLETSSDRLGPVGIQEVFRFPYPAATAVALAPFGILPYQVAAAVVTVLLTLSIAVGLRILGVSDWRVYGLAYATVTVGGAVRIGTLTPFLFLGLAVAWRYRDRRWIAASALAASIVAKMFLWPMLVWLVATRRLRTAGTAALLAGAATILGWAILGFAGLTQYPELLRRLTAVVGDRGYSMVALGVHAGLGEETARLLPWMIGLPVLALAVAVGRRGGGDVASFVLALVASLLLTPIVWLHYFTLLLIPIALTRPRLSPVWLLPLAYWVTPFQENEGHLWMILVATTLAVAAVVVGAFPGRERTAGDASTQAAAEA